MLVEHSKLKIQLYQLQEQLAESETPDQVRLEARKQSESLQAKMFTIEQRNKHIMSIQPKY